MSVSCVPIPPPLPATSSSKEPFKIAENQESSKRKDVLVQCKEIIVELGQVDSQISDRQRWVMWNVDVKAKLQGNAPRCGLVSLSMAAEMAINLNQTNQPTTNSSILTKYIDTESELTALLNLAKELSFTSKGEMFSAYNLSILAKEFYGLEAEVLGCGLDDVEAIVNHLYAGNPILVPYDASANHSPCLTNGRTAHWAVLTGFFCPLHDGLFNLENLQEISSVSSVQLQTTQSYQVHIHTLLKRTSSESCFPLNINRSSLYLLARQPKSRHVAVWPWTNLNDSNANLVEYNRDKESARNYVFPKGGLSENLSRKIIYLWKN